MRYRATWCMVAMFALAACASDAQDASPTAPRNTGSTSTTVSITSNARTLAEQRCTGNTIELEQCLTERLNAVDGERTRISADLVAGSLAKEWQRSEQAFVRYRAQTCHAVYFASIEGTWRGMQDLSCRIRLTRERVAFLRAALEGKGI